MNILERLAKEESELLSFNYIDEQGTCCEYLFSGVWIFDGQIEEYSTKVAVTAKGKLLMVAEGIDYGIHIVYSSFKVLKSEPNIPNALIRYVEIGLKAEHIEFLDI